jgi:hypothetical protein
MTILVDAKDGPGADGGTSVGFWKMDEQARGIICRDWCGGRLSPNQIQ